MKKFLKKLTEKLGRKKSSKSNDTPPELPQLPDELSELAIKVDFLVTYYQLNCLLVDRFTDSDYFARNSKLEAILDVKPVKLLKENLVEIENKLVHL